MVALSVIRQPPAGLAVLAGLSTGHRVLLVVTAAVTEEILYRGYPIERLAQVTGHLWAGAAAAGVIFLAVHLPFWGPAALPLQTTATAGLVGLYVWQRNLAAAMIAHATIDALLLLVLPALA
jgi:membrane protease YdiL (CAAX protease family)